jgi:imidazolonepropionase-like amidohydrolase
VREQFVKAQEYRAKLRAAGDDATKRPARDLAMEALVEVLDGKRTVHFHTHRHDDIITVLRLAEEFGFKPVLQHVSEGWKVADEIAKAGVSASIIIIDSPGGKLETVDVAFKTAACWKKPASTSGSTPTTTSPTRGSSCDRRDGGARGHVARQGAVRDDHGRGADAWARHRIGTLEPGKDADFIVLSGDPLSVYTHVEQTWVEGLKVFDRSNPEDRKVATGGYGALRDEAMELDGEGEGR